MRKIFYFLGHEQFQPEELVEHAILAEKNGFDGVFVSEHFNPWVNDVGRAGFAFSTLGAIAVKTEKLLLMTGVVTPLFRYHPAVVAQAATTIDRLSHGRFMLGVGTGEPINEVPLGYMFPDYKERSQRMQEALIIMRQLLDSKEVVFNGQFYQAHHITLHSPPLHPVPIYLAAGGPKTAQLAAEHADGIIISVKDPRETFEKIISPMKKKLPIVASRWTVFAQNEEEALQALKAWRGLRAPDRDKATHPQQLQDAADKLQPSEILSRYTLVKSAKDYINTYEPLITLLKADCLVIQTTSLNQSKTIELLGTEVVPKLKKEYN